MQFFIVLRPWFYHMVISHLEDNFADDTAALQQRKALFDGHGLEREDPEDHRRESPSYPWTLKSFRRR
jgi:hypothetical protein